MSFRKPGQDGAPWERDVSDAQEESRIRQQAADSGYRVVAGGRNHLPSEKALREACEDLGLSRKEADRRVAEVMRSTRRRFN